MDTAASHPDPEQSPPRPCVPTKVVLCSRHDADHTLFPSQEIAYDPPAGSSHGCLRPQGHAAARFCEEHLSSLAWPLADRLEKTEVQYLALAARAIARRTGPRRDMEATGLTPSAQCDDCPMECGQDQNQP